MGEEDKNHSEEQGNKEEETKKLFKDLKIYDKLGEACNNLGWKVPTKIQLEAIPHALQGKDVIGLAQTGSGKTGAIFF
ncbi:hypothetical protein Drorol1_Dr00000570 [Drosera rotundifolia]